MQDDNLYPHFTVLETMVLAANLKIADMSTDEKNLIVSIEPVAATAEHRLTIQMQTMTFKMK